jgi:hypothetical protein
MFPQALKSCPSPSLGEQECFPKLSSRVLPKGCANKNVFRNPSSRALPKGCANKNVFRNRSTRALLKPARTRVFQHSLNSCPSPSLREQECSAPSQLVPFPSLREQECFNTLSTRGLPQACANKSGSATSQLVHFPKAARTRMFPKLSSRALPKLARVRVFPQPPSPIRRNSCLDAADSPDGPSDRSR